VTDYECPACGGGFPAADADGECPWCGEAMADSEGDRPRFDIGSVPVARTTTVTDDVTTPGGAGTQRDLFGGDER
jgi:uncharacterized Zn finger protein (UPF0148 family)